jgi:RTA1 like protein
MATGVNPTTGLPADYVPGFVCHLGTCNVAEWGFVHYQPSMIGNVLFLVIIDLLGAAHLILNPYHGTGLFGISMLLGLSSESAGYVARIMLHYDPFNRAYFLWYLITLTIGPVFIGAAIYLCLGRIVVVYGEEISRIKPRGYTMFFLGCDFIALCVQTVGGGIAASAPITNRPMVMCSFAVFHFSVLLILVAQSWNPYSCGWPFLPGCEFVCILGVQS